MAQSFAAKAYWLRSTALLCALSAPLMSSAAFAETLTYAPNAHRQTWSQPPQDVGALIDNPYQMRRSFIKSGQAQPTVKPLRLPPQARAEAAPKQAPQPVKSPPPQPAKPLKIVIPNINPGETKAAQAPAVKPAEIQPRQQLVASAPPAASLPEAMPQQAEAAPESQPGPVSTSFSQQPQQYHSPGIIIRRHEIIETGDRSLAMQQPLPTPEELAQLAPAAGGEIAGGPLIPTPQTPDPPQPAGDLADHVDAEAPREAQGPGDIVITDITTSKGVIDTGRSSETDSGNVDMMQTLGAQSPAPQARSGMPNLLPLLTPVEKSSGAPLAVTAGAVENTGEPTPDLSNESKRIAGEIPSNIDKRSNARPAKVDIARAKHLENIFTPPPEPAAESVSKHEMPGLSIEVRSRKANINYELEKAYNALISGQTEAAIATYQSVLESDPKNINALFGLAATYHRAGQIELARPLYGKILAIDPDNREALNNFMVLMADESPQAALEQLERLEQRNPDFSPIPAQMAVIYQKLGNMGKASEKMFQAVALAPENLTYRYNLAVLMDKQQKYDEAARLYRQLLEAHDRGETLPGNAQKIQERLTFISSNRR